MDQSVTPNEQSVTHKEHLMNSKFNHDKEIMKIIKPHYIKVKNKNNIALMYDCYGKEKNTKTKFKCTYKII